LGNILSKSFNIDTPKCRIIDYKNPEYLEIINNIRRVTSLYNQNIPKNSSHDLDDKLFILLLEYIPSLNLFDFVNGRSHLIFSEKSNYRSREIFISIGRILAMDIFLNNSDRIPFIWNKTGNLENLLFRVDPDSVLPNCDFKDSKYLDIFIQNAIAFNTKVFSLDPHDRLDLKKLGEYLIVLSEFFKEFFYEIKNLIFDGINIDSMDFKVFNKLSEVFINSTGGYLISNQNIFHLSIGLITMLDDITIVKIEDVDNAVNFVKHKAISEDWGDSYKTKAKNLSVDYFKYLINYFKQLKSENEEIYAWVGDVTQGIYSTDFSSNVFKELQYHEKNKLIKSNKIPIPSFGNKSNPNQIENKFSSLEKYSNQNQNYEKTVDYDDFNYNINDKKKFRNDVHNGVYDLMNIDDKMVLQVVKRDFRSLPKQKDIEIKDLKNNSQSYDQHLNKSPNREEDSFDGKYKKYTIDELKDKIKRDELKETLNIKRSFNPEEGKFLEERIKEVDEDFFNETGNDLNKNVKTSNDKLNKNINNNNINNKPTNNDSKINDTNKSINFNDKDFQDKNNTSIMNTSESTGKKTLAGLFNKKKK